MSARYTPGPWAMCADYPHGRTTVCDYEQGRGPFRKVAQCRTDRGLEQDEANAALIASAPDMLEALRSIAECCDEDHAARDYSSRQTEIRGIARAAIDKAEGGRQ